jgi:cytoskeletal protein CcmA (bactofilin family)
LTLSSILALSLLTITVVAQQAGETVTIDQPLFSDQYLAGRFVQVTAPIQGDLVIAGQELVVDAPIGGDLIAAGQSLDLRNSVSDDVRAAGRTLTLDAQIMGHAVAAGAEVILTSDASVGDWTWFAGRRVTVEGQVGGELRAAGQSVMVSGEIGGDAVLAAEEIQIEPGAVIRGDLIWDSDIEPEISANATVEGEIIREDLTGTLGSFGESDGLASAVFFAIALIAASLTVFLVFPGFSGSVAGRIQSTPIRTFALGIGMIIGVPIIIALLFASRIGWIVAIGTLFGYLLLLLCAMVFGLVSVGKLGLELTNKGKAGRRPVHLLAIGLGVVLILLLAQIPVMGTIVLLMVLFSGLGAISGEFWRRYRQPA